MKFSFWMAQPGKCELSVFRECKIIQLKFFGKTLHRELPKNRRSASVGDSQWKVMEVEDSECMICITQIQHVTILDFSVPDKRKPKIHKTSLSTA